MLEESPMSNPVAVSSLQQLSNALIDVVALASRSVVGVHSARSRSSGFIWRPNFVVTADEALAEEGAISVASPNGETASATVVGRDPTTDVALLRVERANAPTIAFEPVSLGVGALALVVGSQN